MNITKYIVLFFVLGIVLFSVVTMFYGQQNSSKYVIELDSIDSAAYKNGKLSVELKPKEWSDMLEFSTRNIGKKVTIFIDGFDVTAHIYLPLYSSIEISPVDSSKFSSKFKHILAEKESVVDSKIRFIKRALEADKSSYFLQTELILLYYEKNDKNSSQMAINSYEGIESQTEKERVAKEYFRELYDCYIEVDDIRGAFDLLEFIKGKINEREEYLRLEKKGYLYFLKKDKKNAKIYYQKALDKLYQTDFITDDIESNTTKKYIESIKAKEEKRIKYNLNVL